MYEKHLILRLGKRKVCTTLVKGEKNTIQDYNSMNP